MCNGRFLSAHSWKDTGNTQFWQSPERQQKNCLQCLRRQNVLILALNKSLRYASCLLFCQRQIIKQSLLDHPVPRRESFNSCTTNLSGKQTFLILIHLPDFRHNRSFFIGTDGALSIVPPGDFLPIPNPIHLKPLVRHPSQTASLFVD